MLGSEPAPVCLSFSEKETEGETEQLGLPPAASDPQMGADEEQKGSAP